MTPPTVHVLKKQDVASVVLKNWEQLEKIDFHFRTEV